MTKEQEEALKTMQHWINYEKENKNKINKADELIKIQETVLNMLKEKEERIEYLQRSCERKEQSLIEEQQENADLTVKIEKKDKIIDLMTKSIELQQYVNIDTTNLDLICNEFKCNKKCKLVKEDCIKQYFERKVEEC